MKGDLRCIEGRLMRHDPQDDDPYLETDVGECPDCSGDGCGDWKTADGCEENCPPQCEDNKHGDRLCWHAVNAGLKAVKEAEAKQ